MIFFSDAVFAIAITLLALDIKFPELKSSDSSQMMWRAFYPTIVRFGTFTISFVFIASMWYRHLQLFRFLCNYDTGLIFRNLIFIFFIVCFRFVVSGLENLSKGFLLPMFLYVLNIAFTVLAHYALCRYILVTQPRLCTVGNHKQKKYILMQATATAIIFVVTLVKCAITYVLTGGDWWSFVLSVYTLPVLPFVSRILLKKHKLAAKIEQSQALEAEA